MVTAALGSAPLILLWRHAAYALFARTTAGPDGIRNRMIRTMGHLTWDDVESFEIGTSAGAAPSRRERLRLGCILIGVFLAAFAGLSAGFDRPWNRPFWPGRHEASSAQTATRLRLRYDRYDREIGWGGSGSDLAHTAFAKPNLFLHAAWAPVTGLGDQARSTVPRSGDGHNWVEVVARRANVVVTVDYMAPGATGQATAGATRTAAAAISQIRLR